MRTKACGGCVVCGVRGKVLTLPEGAVLLARVSAALVEADRLPGLRTDAAWRRERKRFDKLLTVAVEHGEKLIHAIHAR